MAYVSLPQEDWEQVCARVDHAGGDVSWRWAAMLDYEGKWKLATLVATAEAPALPAEALSYRDLTLGREVISAATAAHRLRKGIAVTGNKRVGEITFVPPNSPVRPRHRTTATAGPYPSRSGWPEYEVSYDSDTEHRGLQISNLDQLVEPGMPVYPSGQHAITHFVLGVPPDERASLTFGNIIVRIPDMRARIAALDLKRNRVHVRLEGDTSACALRLTWREANSSIDRGTHDWPAPPAAVRMPFRGIPYEASVYLVADDGSVIDSRGWEGAHGDRPEVDPWDPRRVLDTIRAGEDEHSEFKQQIDRPGTLQRVARSVAAFANGTGGVVYFGVTNDAQVVGAGRDLRDSVDDAIRQRVRPQPPSRWRSLRLQQKPVQALVVDAGADRPYRADKIVWIRVHATTREAEADEIRSIAGADSNASMRGGWHG